jgi:hypothetical protein
MTEPPPHRQRGRPKNMSHHLAEEMIANPIGAKFAETPWQSQHLRGGHDVYRRGGLFICYRRRDLVGDKVG